ncbi:hypothetical protein I250019C1_04330 [Faecalibacterium sp. i25-0019-C1]
MGGLHKQKRPPCDKPHKGGRESNNFHFRAGRKPSRLHPSPCSSGMQTMHRGYTFVHSTTPR